MVSRADEDIDLARAAAYIAGTEYPDVDVDNTLSMLDALAEGAADYIDGAGDPDPSPDLRSRLQRLGEFLSSHQGFHGNDEDYYDPRNSYTNEVLDRRTGIPITLALVYMAVGSRLGIEGIGLPGHFVLRAGPPEEELYVDAFNQGQIMSRSDCESTVRSLFQGRVQLEEEHLRPYTKKEFLIRVLTNLKQNYARLGDYRRAISCADLIQATDPSLGSNLKERAAFHYHVKEYRMAMQDLELYLRAAPQAQDADEVKRQVRHIRSILERLN